MICKKCKNNIPDTAKFCSKCGAKVEVEKPQDVIICPRCGTENPLTARFCRKDGTPLKEEAKPEKIIEREPKEVAPTKARKASIWIAISILIIILAGAGSYLYFSGIIGKKPKEVTITQPLSFTKRFKGAIGEYKIQMELHRQGDNLSGTYFYEKIGKNLYLKGTVDDKGNFIINAFDDKGNQTDIFKGKFTSSSELSGMWCKPSGEKTLPFLLQELSSLSEIPKPPEVTSPEEEPKPPRYIAYDKAREDVTKGNIGAIRGALVVYYGDHEGNYPDNINHYWGGGRTIGTITLQPFSLYIEGGVLPRAMLRRRSGVANLDSNYARIGGTGTPVNMDGGWLYHSDTGQVFVNADTTDTEGVHYSTY